ncbi:hypothetical protein RHOER0001_2713 [Rhodococcus erythropolis SK121]|nr:hypothetical protein RHOER0001_2713 [Rhodococcus erythropolis SK121]
MIFEWPDREERDLTGGNSQEQGAGWVHAHCHMESRSLRPLFG